MKRHSILLVAALVATALAATACSKTATNTNATNSNTTTNTSKSSNSTTANTSTPTTTGASTPTAAFKAIYEAAKNKDVAGFKKNLASSDLKGLDDNFLKEMMNSPENNVPPTLETRNEKIDGDKATLESKKKNGDWETINFVKEGSEWKVKLGGAKEEDAGEPKK